MKCAVCETPDAFIKNEKGVWECKVCTSEFYGVMKDEE